MFVDHHNSAIKTSSFNLRKSQKRVEDDALAKKKLWPRYIFMISTMSLFNFHPLFTVRFRITNKRRSIFFRSDVILSFTMRVLFKHTTSKLQLVDRSHLTHLNLFRHVFVRDLRRCRKELVRVAVVTIKIKSHLEIEEKCSIMGNKKVVVPFMALVEKQ